MITKILISMFIVFNFNTCSTIAEDKMSKIPIIPNESIEFEGNQRSKKVAIELLDKVLKEQGDLGAYGDLTGGIEVLTKDMDIRIKEERANYEIYITPKSDSGHCFSFTINKKSGKMSSSATIGNVLPPPDLD